MSRTKEFDHDQVLDRAMHLFWEKGYEATSMQDLVDRMGINRGSLYSTFGGKHDLFIAAIDRYANVITGEMLASLADSRPATEIIRHQFECLLTDRAALGKGCLIANSAVERCDVDRAAAGRIMAVFTRIEDAFAALVERGQAEGDIAKSLCPRAAARFLLAQFSGVRVLAQGGTERARLADAVEVALSVLDG